MIGEWEENDVQTPWCCDCDNNFSLLLLNKQARCTPLKHEWQNYGFILLALFRAGQADMPACFKLSPKRCQGSSTDLAFRVLICTLRWGKDLTEKPLFVHFRDSTFLVGVLIILTARTRWTCLLHEDMIEVPWHSLCFQHLHCVTLAGCLSGVNRKIWPWLMEVDFGISPLEKQCCND